jgi:tRNA1(Val) A37 N6-methylase TrmN6
MLLTATIGYSLNFNHFWMKSIAGYLLHPKIPTDQEGLRIADLGAGTGLVSLPTTDSKSRAVRTTD